MAISANHRERLVYRSRAPLFVAAFFFATLAILAGEAATLSWTVAMPFCGLIAAPAVWIYWILVRSKLVVHPNGVTIVNPREVVHLRWDEIERVILVRWRLTFLCVDGRAVGARGVSASAISFALGRRSYPDRVAEALNQRLVEGRGERWNDLSPRYTVTPGELILRTVLDG